MSIKQAIEALEQLVVAVQNATPDEGCEQSIAHARGMGEAAIQSLRSIPDAKPVAWAIFTDAGNARMWTTFQPHVQKLADAEGLTVTPLYAEPAALAALRSMPQGEPVPDRESWPTVPANVMTCIHAYGDSRADDDGFSAIRIGAVVYALREWAGALAATPHPTLSRLTARGDCPTRTMTPSPPGERTNDGQEND